MARMTIEARRRIRAMEAKRDKMIESKAKITADLIKTRVELKHARQVGGK